MQVYRQSGAIHYILKNGVNIPLASVPGSFSLCEVNLHEEETGTTTLTYCTGPRGQEEQWGYAGATAMLLIEGYPVLCNCPTSYEKCSEIISQTVSPLSDGTALSVAPLPATDIYEIKKKHLRVRCLGSIR